MIGRPGPVWTGVGAALAGALLMALTGAGPARAAGDASTPPIPDTYRMDDYRSAVPDRVPGATTLDTAQARQLHEGGRAVFVDVLPAPRRPEGLAPGTLWLPRARYHIPGTVWLPDVGYGHLSPETESYLWDNLDAAVRGDRDRPVVVYCLAECWMSWNAARRIAAGGYRQVYWYPEGTDGWEAADLPLVRGTPVPAAGD